MALKVIFQSIYPEDHMHLIYSITSKIFIGGNSGAWQEFCDKQNLGNLDHYRKAFCTWKS